MADWRISHTQAPVMHRTLSVGDRCECALTGFVLLDLFRLVAADRCAPRMQEDCS